MSPPDFGKLPSKYQRLLQLAKEKYNLDVVPLELLKGGQTGAFLYLVSVTIGDYHQVEHFVVKFDHVNERAKSTEVERHRLALSQAPKVFAEQHMARLTYEVEYEGAVALFYTLAGQSLQRFRTLASQEGQSRLENLFIATIDNLLKGWNIESTFEQAIHPQKLMEMWLGYRLKPDSQIGSFIKDTIHANPNVEGFLINGQIFPNPFSYGLNSERWKQTRSIDVLKGFQHGDLNIGNILANFTDDLEKLEGYFLIDFALYKANMPLFYDQCYLEMSFLIRELERAPFGKWVSLVVNFSSRDIPNPKDVPVELAGVCSVIITARKTFKNWIDEVHPSLSDDLWGQFWLAAVAAGLNFCNKTALSTEGRLAGLIYSAAHLKRYCAQFGVPLPVDVRLLYDSSKVAEATQNNKLAPSNTSLGKNLPVQPTPFIGRLVEVVAVKELLMRENVHLVTLTGPGGIGKTRLALQAAAELIDRFEDGVYFVDLAPTGDPDSVLSAIARTIGLRETTDRLLLDEIKELLRSKKVLLLLDNFEHVTAAGPKVGEMLRDCPQLKVLVTSREALHLRGEHIFPIPTLGLPGVDLKRQSIEELSQFESVQLFIERALAVKPEFKVTNENAPAVAEICMRLDGLPLAIELAAARVRMFTPQALLERVGSRLKLLRGGARDLPLRQQTLHGTIDWSFELLDIGEKRLFALLSVFPSCTFEAAEGVASGIMCSDEVGRDILDGLASLIDKSLIRQIDRDAGETRLMMLETIREYAEERLEEDKEFEAAARKAHATYYSEFTQRQWERLTGNERDLALEKVESEIENIRTAWHYWVTEANLEQLHKLTDCLWLLYDAKGWYHANVDLTADLLNVFASTPSTPERVQQEIMLQTSLARALMAIKGPSTEVEEAYTRALELCQGEGEIPQLFPVLRGLSSYYIYVGDFEKGVQMGEQILILAERQDDSNMRVEGHLVLGYNLAFLRDLNLGLDHLDKGIANFNPDQRSLSRFRQGNNAGVACYTTSALVSWMLGFPDNALKRASSAVDIATNLNHPYSLAYALFHAGLLHLWRREVELVQDRARAVIHIAEKHDFQVWRAVAICLHGAALAGMGHSVEGLTQFSQGINLYQELKTPPIFWPLLLYMWAGVYGQGGKSKEGLTQIDEALEIISHSSARALLPEFCRLKGELLLALSRENVTEAELLFQEALEVAQMLQARMLELRASLSLSRLMRDQGKTEHARQVLNDAYVRMTEGFTIADLEDARSFLAELS
ncbi:MAG: ATP-binding protein [Thermodesulfobacteriota bacterium]